MIAIRAAGFASVTLRWSHGRVSPVRLVWEELTEPILEDADFVGFAEDEDDIIGFGRAERAMSTIFRPLPKQMRAGSHHMRRVAHPIKARAEGWDMITMRRIDAIQPDGTIKHENSGWLPR